MDEWSDEWAPEVEPGDELLNRRCPWIVAKDGRVLFGLNGDLHDDVLIEHGLTMDDVAALGEITTGGRAEQLRPGGHEYEDEVQEAYDHDHFDPHTAAGLDEWAPEFNRPAATSMYKFVHRPDTGDIDFQSIHDNYTTHDQMIQRHYAPGEYWSWKDWRTGYAEVMPGPNGEPIPKVMMYEHDPILERYAWEQLQQRHPEVQQWPQEAFSKPVGSPETPWYDIPGSEDLPAHLGGKRRADYQGWSNWETWNTKLMMDNERETYDASRKLVEQGNKQAFIDWAIRSIVGPHNQQEIEDAREWNSIPQHERLDYSFEDLKERNPQAADIVDQLGFGPNVEDSEPTLIDPQLVNWDEIWDSIARDLEEERRYQQGMPPSWQEPQPQVEMDAPGDLTIPNEWISKTAAPEDWGPIRIDELSEPYDFRMPTEVEQRFVNAYECPECKHTLRKTEHGAACPYCGWNSNLRMANDWAPLFDEGRGYGPFMKRRPFMVQGEQVMIGDPGTHHPNPHPENTALGEIWEDTSPARISILYTPRGVDRERAKALAERAYFQMQDKPEQRTASNIESQRDGNYVYHAAPYGGVDLDDVWMPRTPYLYDPEHDLLHWGEGGWWHSDLRPIVQQWERDNGMTRNTHGLVGGAVIDGPTDEVPHAVYERSLPEYAFDDGQVNPEHDRVRARIEELVGSPIMRYENPDTILNYAQPPTSEPGSSDWAPRLGADMVPGNEGHWVWLDGQVGFGGEHHEIARTLAQRLGYDPTTVNFISNTLARNGMPEGHQVAVGTIRGRYPQIYNSTVDRNAVWDDVARNYEGFSKSAGIKEDAQRAYESLINTGGFSLTQSLDAASGQAYFTSYAQPTKIIPVEQFSPTDIEQWRHEVLPLLQGDPENLIGGWLDGGLVYLDVSRAFQDEHEAVQFGIANQQKAVWDGFNGREIRLDMGQDELREARVRKLGSSVQWAAPIYSEHLAAPMEHIAMGLRGDLPAGMEFKVEEDTRPGHGQWYVSAWLNGQQVGGMTIEDGIINAVEVVPEYRRMGVATEMARQYYEHTGSIPQHDWENQSADGRQWAQWHDPEGLEDHKEQWGDMWDPDEEDPAMLDAIRRAEESERARAEQTCPNCGSPSIKPGGYLGDPSVPYCNYCGTRVAS